MAEQSLREKTVRGVGWSAIDNVAQYAVSFIVSIVLARLLTPDDYGLLGIISIFTAISTALINGGFTNALIRKKDVNENDYNTSFIINLAVSIILYIIIFFSAPLIAVFFEHEELVLLTRVSTFSIVIGALAIVPQTRLTKRIDFKTQTRITLSAAIVSGIVGIVMAICGCGVWSLVAQLLSSQFIKTTLLWLYTHWIPKLLFSKNSFNDLFGFGWKMLLSELINAVWKELYQVVIGKFYSPAALGQYTRANQFSQLFSSNLTNVIQRVTFPVLSDIQDDKIRMLNAYRRIIKTSMFITATSMFFLGAVSEPLLYCLIGPKWHEASIYLPFICISSSLYPLQAINLNMLQVQGRSDLFLGLEVVKKALGMIPLFVGILVGIIPMLCVNIIISIMSYFLNSFFSGKLLGYSTKMQIKDIAPSYLIATGIALVVWFLKYLSLSMWIILPLQIMVGFGVLLFLCEITRIEEYAEVKHILFSFYKKK